MPEMGNANTKHKLLAQVGVPDTAVTAHLRKSFYEWEWGQLSG